MPAPSWGVGFRQWFRSTEARRTSDPGDVVIPAADLLTSFDEVDGTARLFVGDGINAARDLEPLATALVEGVVVRTSATAGDPYVLAPFTDRGQIIRVDGSTDADLVLGDLGAGAKLGARLVVVYLNTAFPARTLTVRNDLAHGALWGPPGNLTVLHGRPVEFAWDGIAWRLIDADRPTRAEVTTQVGAVATAAASDATTKANAGRDSAKTYADAQDVLELAAAKAYADSLLSAPTFRRTGAKAETFSRRSTPATSVTAALVSGQESIFAIELKAGTVVNKITFLSGSTGATTPTAQWFTLRKADFTLLGVTSDSAAGPWASGSEKGLFLTNPTTAALAPYTVPTDGLYYVGIMVAATTVPALAGFTPTANVMGLAPMLSARDTTNTGKTTPSTAQATLTPSNLSAHAYVWVS